jgi:hypothetical protein
MGDASKEPGTVLWTQGLLVCTGVINQTDKPYEIRLFVDGVLISAEFFPDYHAAARYALDKLHAYRVG